MNPNLCTIDTCDLSMASFDYIPSLGGNALFAAIFGILIVGQLFLGIRHKTWGYMTAMILGLLLEIVGYVARVMLNGSPFNNNDFLMYLICLTIAPALLSASVCLLTSCIRWYTKLIILLGISLPRSNRHSLWRPAFSLPTSNLYHIFLHLRFCLPCSPGRWGWHCINSKHSQPKQ
jgi:hypothetical protein